MSEFFDGYTYEPEFDLNRLSSQLQKVKHLMLDQQWRTLEDIARVVGGSEAGVSARLRDLRKPRFGGYTVKRRRVGIETRGLFEYQLMVGS